MRGIDRRPRARAASPRKMRARIRQPLSSDHLPLPRTVRSNPTLALRRHRYPQPALRQ